MLFLILTKILIALEVDLPNVKSIDCNEAKLASFDKCLVITISGEMEYAGLAKVDGFESVLEGSLFTTSGEQKEGTRVSVTLKDANKALVSQQLCLA